MANQLVSCLLDLHQELGIDVNGTTKLQVGEHLINFQRPWKRYTMFEAIEKYTGIDISAMDEKELQANISNKYLAAYDNVSGFDHTVSDMLCRALSGDEISKRSLYSNNDLFVKSYSKKKL